MRNIIWTIALSGSFVLSSLGMGHLPNHPTQESVKAITQKVADWQIETYADMGKYRALPAKKEDRRKWHHRRRYTDVVWNAGALYAGMVEWSTITDDPKYINWLLDIGYRNDWRLDNHKTVFNADNHTVGLLYTKCYERFGDEAMLEPLMAGFDEILNSPEKDTLHWSWADALFMSPAVWAQLASVKDHRRYLEYMDQQYHLAYDRLWNAKDQLFYRDKGKMKNREKNGANEYWARGNGWVYGGLTYMLPYLSNWWDGRPFYVDLFQQMSQALKRTQRSDGTWSMGMMGAEADYPSKDTSGSTFFVFGLARGVNMGILDRATYEPVIFKGWQALVDCVRKDGLVGYVQGVGAAPGETFADYTELYGTGGFLAAGAEVYKMLGGERPAILPKSSSLTTFMKDGGWCWFQDPRAIIRNGKLILGGTSGTSGDIRVAVYDLAADQPLGTVVLHKGLENDDHDDPAFYLCPDGRILAVYAKHAREKIHYCSWSDPDDFLKWSEPKPFVHDYDHKRGVTYMNLYPMQDEGLLYNFFRDGPTFNPYFITSPDQGKTWGNRTHFIADEINGNARPYARYMQCDANTVAVSFTDAHPRKFGNSIHYAEFRGGAFYRADGSKIKDVADGPLQPSEAEKIFKGSEILSTGGPDDSAPNSAWTSSMAQDATGNPHLGYTLYVSNDDHRYRMASWNGEKWIDREVAYGGDRLYTRESSYTGLITLDPTDPTQVVISTDVDPSTGKPLGSKHEIFTATVQADDDIQTIEWTPLTTDSIYKNIRPIIVAGEGYKVLMWMYGPWTTNTRYQPDIVGQVLARPTSNGVRK